MKRLAIALLSFTALAACNTLPPPEPPSREQKPQRWICGREYENHAWGYQRRGVVLDNTGTIWRYDIKSSPAALVNPWQPKNLANLTENELQDRYNGAADTGKRIDPEEIARRMALIRDASTAQPTEPRHVGADMGATVLYCLARNVPGATYRQVLIDQKGDMETTNPSSAAKELATWLNGVFKGAE